MIELNGLVKRFGALTAVDGISLRVKKGEVLGFLGPNGAGKSTTMKMVTGYLTPSSGSVHICGHDMARASLAAQSAIGYLPEGAPAYGEMNPRQFLAFNAKVRGFKGDLLKKAVAKAVARTQLEKVLEQPIETLSKGFQRRVGLAASILHDPPVLIMDEPTDGLDPNQKFAVRRLITSMAKEKAIIISTHILEEVDAVCSRAVIIDNGKIVADGTPAELMARSRYHNAVIVEVANAQGDEAAKALRAHTSVAALTEARLPSYRRFTLFPRSPNDLLIEDISPFVRSKSWDVRGLYAEAGRLDEVFRTLTTSDASASAESDLS
jgi:gliding motility-associated transport system ATP-binding protein